MDNCEIINYLTAKYNLLERIIKNSKLQQRSVRKLDMRGLKRLLIERAKMIDELAVICDKLENNEALKLEPSFSPILTAIEKVQHEALTISDQVLQDALAERNKLAAELNIGHLMRQAKSRYVTQWTLNESFHSLNAKG